MQFEDVNYTLRETGRKIGRLFQREPRDAVSPLLVRIFNTFIINRLDSPEDTGPHYYPGDSERQYFLNSLGYRSPEFGSAELLVAGCSHSYGVGIDSGYRWGDVLARNLGLSADNVSIPGYSIVELVETIYTYIDTYGAPKYIVCLFPDVYRAPYIMVEGLTSSQDSETHKFSLASNKDQSIWLETTHCIDAKPPSISKKPHIVEEIIPPEHYLYENIRAIKSLETLCNAANIKFAWSTWDTDFSLVIKYLSNYGHAFKSYVDVDAMEWKRDSSIGDVYLPNNSCHTSEYKWFNHGSDFEYGVDRAHFGAHRHLHYAEKFSDKIKNAT